MPPNIAMPTATLATIESTAVRFARTFSGTNGSGARRSTRRVIHPSTSVADDERGRGPREPREVGAGEGHPEQRQAGGDGDEERTQVVDPRLAPNGVQVQLGLKHDDRDDRERHADVERPAPPPRVDDEPAEQWAADRGHGHDRTHVARVPAAFPGRDDRAHDGGGEGGEPAHTDPLDDAAGDEERDVVGHTRGDRARHEDDRRTLDEDLLAEQVRELAPDGCGHRRREERGRDDPRVLALRALEVADDRRQRGRDDGRRQHRREQRGEQPGHGPEDLPVGHLTGDGSGGSASRVASRVARWCARWDERVGRW